MPLRQVALSGVLRFSLIRSLQWKPPLSNKRTSEGGVTPQNQVNEVPAGLKGLSVSVSLLLCGFEEWRSSLELCTYSSITPRISASAPHLHWQPSPLNFSIQRSRSQNERSQQRKWPQQSVTMMCASAKLQTLKPCPKTNQGNISQLARVNTMLLRKSVAESYSSGVYSVLPRGR